MAHDQELDISLQQRVNNYLRSKSPATNIFSAAARDAEAADADLNEYLLKRAEEELRKAQERVEALRASTRKSVSPEERVSAAGKHGDGR